ncbi:MAG: CDP-alcohol phosphatidyltransferase family protein [Bacteroidales bacterium]|nr:CDP-alcohol phosphatidyltransferase family protein [Bacteroidales bacterium]
MKKNIPNIITLLNLISGSVALYLVLSGKPQWAIIFFFAAVVFDFADGLAARLLKATSEIGKQLDSLADLVSFGLVPAAMIFMLLQQRSDPPVNGFAELNFLEKGMLVSVLIVPALAALRLAKYNLLPPSDFFAGLPAPAFALFWTGVYYDIVFSGELFGQAVGGWFLWGVMVVMSVLMVVPLPMLSLKFKSFGLIDNFSRYLLLLIAAVILVFTGIAGLPLVILTYILLSLVRILLT